MVAARCRQPLWRERLAGLGVSEAEALALARSRFLKFVQRLPPGVEHEDFWAVAVAGMIRALERLETDRGCRWSTWAVYAIDRAMLDERRRQDPVSPKQRLTAERRGLDLMLIPYPTDLATADDPPAGLIDPTDVEEEVMERLDAGRLPESCAREVREAVDRLPEPARTLIRGIYLEGASREAVAARLSITPSVLSACEKSALAALRRML